MNKFNRSLPYFKALTLAENSRKISILQAFPQFVVDDLMEVILNVVRGTTKLPGVKLNILRKHSKPLLDLVNTKNKRLMRRVMYKQNGKFLGAIVPIILSTLGSIIGRNL